MDQALRNASQVLSTLVDLDDSAQFDRALVFTKPMSGSPNLYMLVPTSELGRRFVEIDSKQATRWSQRPLIEYIPGRQIPDGHLMYLPATDVPLLVSLALENVAKRTFPLFDPGSAEAGPPRMTITMASRGSLRPAFFRFMRPTARLARSGLVAAIFRGPAFDVLRDEVLLFSENVDAIAIGGWIFFANRNNFDRSFEFLALIQQKAAQTFDDITAHLAIDGLAELRAAATKDVNMMAKLASIQRKIDKHPEYTKALQMAQLLAFIDSNPHVDMDIVGEGADRRLLFIAAPQRRWKILKLLDDDYLRSNLTTMDYEIDSKGDPFG
jgi:Domain of unknown function (DUF4868)